MNAQLRQYLYGIITVAVPILVVYGIVKAEDVPMWIALAAAVLGTGTATVAVTKQRRDGTLD